MASPDVLSKVPILSRVLNWKDLSTEISSLLPMERSVAMAVAVSASEVLPKVTSDELGGLDDLVTAGALDETGGLAPADLSMVARGRAVVSRVCLV